MALTGDDLHCHVVPALAAFRRQLRVSLDYPDGLVTFDFDSPHGHNNF
jgi:hypothetical protein